MSTNADPGKPVLPVSINGTLPSGNPSLKVVLAVLGAVASCCPDIPPDVMRCGDHTDSRPSPLSLDR